MEHYGIAMSASTVRRITEYHAHGIDAQDAAREVVTGVPDNRTFIGETDGSMVPVVNSPPDAQDRRKGKTLSTGQNSQIIDNTV